MRSESKPRFRLDHGRLVPIQELAPGSATGTNEFSNRGLPTIYPEVTMWPKRLQYRLTTGQPPHVMGPPDPVKLSNQELEISKILGLSGEELGTFLRSWQPGLPGSTTWYGRGARPGTREEFGRALSRSK